MAQESGGSEKFHGAVVDHVGHENTRVFKDVTRVGEVLKKLDEVVGTSVQSEVAVIYDWENRWALEDAQGYNNSSKKYFETVVSHYRPFWQAGVSVDVIDMEQPLDDYKLLIAPMLYMLRPGIANRIKTFVKKGGVLVATYASGIVNETDLCFLGGFPGPLKSVFGIWVEETDSLYPEDRNHVITSIEGFSEKSYEVVDMCDLIHLEGASGLGDYQEDFYAGQAALTSNQYGDGKAYYIGFRNNKDFEKDFYNYLIEDLDLKKILMNEVPKGISVQTRYDEKNTFIFIMNFNKVKTTVLIDEKPGYEMINSQKVSKEITLSPYSVAIIRYKKV